MSNVLKFLIFFLKTAHSKNLFSFFNPYLSVPCSTFLMAFFLILHSPQVTLSWCNRTILISNNQFYYYKNLRDRTLNTYHVISFDKTSLHFSKSNIMKRKFNNYKNLWHKGGVNMHSICTAVQQHISFHPHTKSMWGQRWVLERLWKWRNAPNVLLLVISTLIALFISYINDWIMEESSAWEEAAEALTECTYWCNGAKMRSSTEESRVNIHYLASDKARVSTSVFIHRVINTWHGSAPSVPLNLEMFTNNH